jgi:type IV secretory pathway TrbD component
MIIMLTAVAILTLLSMNLVAMVIGVSILIPSLYFLRKAAKYDPYLWPVFLRHIQYKGYYAPFSRPWRQAKNGRIY